MDLLPRLALVDKRHDDVLCGHERQLLLDTLADDGLVHDKSVRDIVQLIARVSKVYVRQANLYSYQDQAGIRTEERLWQGDSADGRIIETALQPLGSVSLLSVSAEVAQFPSERAKTF